MILDTNALSDLFREPPPPSLLRQIGLPVYHFPVIVLGEIRYGARFSRHPADIERKLQGIIEISVVLSIEEKTSQFYGDIRAELHLRGTPIPHNDLWIAALARQHHMPVVTNDDHFHRVQGLQIISW